MKLMKIIMNQMKELLMNENWSESILYYFKLHKLLNIKNYSLISFYVASLTETIVK